MKNFEPRPLLIWIWLSLIAAFTTGWLFFTNGSHFLGALTAEDSNLNWLFVTKESLWLVLLASSCWLFLMWFYRLDEARIEPDTADEKTKESSKEQNISYRVSINNQNTEANTQSNQKLIQAAKKSLKEKRSSRARINAETSKYRQEYENFTPDHPLDETQLEALQSIPEQLRGGLSITWYDDFTEEDILEDIISSHPKVISLKYQEGRWYSNGEDGPNYYQFHIGCLKSDEAVVRADILEKCQAKIGNSTKQLNL